MELPNNFNYKASVPDISDVIKFSTLKTASDFNCMKIATVEEVHYDDLTVTVRLLNKRTLGNNPDGTPNVRDYALIRAKICYCCPYITFPINVLNKKFTTTTSILVPILFYHIFSKILA